MARGGIPASPLPQRDGVDAVRLRMPQGGPWATLREHLVERLPLSPGQVDEMLAAGEFAGADGAPLAPDAPFVPRSLVWFHRDFAAEVPVPFAVEVIHRDERIVVVDKPPFLATMPRGRHIRESVLARLRVTLGLPRLAAAHRLDRLTSGVLLLTVEQQWRGPYQRLFATGAVAKEYLAVAPAREELTGPVTLSSHLTKPHGQLQAREVPGAPPNAHTVVELLGRAGEVGLYRLVPSTGRTHQLRAQLAGYRIPILGDPLYPVLREVAADDFGTPLSLVASRLAFVDPVDGQHRDFRSTRMPHGWPG